eukprot:1145643-Pelagomonas_calceolata.AAC.2
MLSSTTRAASRRFQKGRGKGRSVMSVSNTVDPSTPSLVNTEWLKWRLGQKGVKLLDASWYMPAQGGLSSALDMKGALRGRQMQKADSLCICTAFRKRRLAHREMPACFFFFAHLRCLQTGSCCLPAPHPATHIASTHRVSVLEGGLPSWESSSGPVSTEGVPDEQLQRPGEAVRNPPSSTRYKAKLDRSKVGHCNPKSCKTVWGNHNGEEAGNVKKVPCMGLRRA